MERIHLVLETVHLHPVGGEVPRLIHPGHRVSSATSRSREERRHLGELCREETRTVQDQSVRSLLHEVLTSSGYRVLVAASGAEALRISRAHSGPLDLLLTDVVMPGMGGREVATVLGTERPGLRVLFASGYTAEAIARQGVLEPGTDLIHKPFTPDALLHRVRERLDRA